MAENTWCTNFKNMMELIEYQHIPVSNYYLPQISSFWTNECLFLSLYSTKIKTAYKSHQTAGEICNYQISKITRENSYQKFENQYMITKVNVIFMSIKNSKSEKKSIVSASCKNIAKLLIAMIFFTASTCLAQKSNWYLFQPNNQGINVEFGNASCSQGSNFFKPIKPYNNQIFENYLAVNAQTDKKGKILFYLISTLDSVYLYNSNNVCIKVIAGYDISPNIISLPGGLRYHLLIGTKLYWFNIGELNTTNNDVWDFQSIDVVGRVKINHDAHVPKYVVKRAVKILKNSCDTFIYRLYSLQANNAGNTGRFLFSKDIVTIGGQLQSDALVGDLTLSGSNNYDLNLNYSISEMELSPNQKELIFSGGSCILRVDVSGAQFGRASRTCFNSNTLANDSNRYFCGVEYITDTLILLSQFQTTDSSSANQGLYLFNIISNTFTKITNSEGFKYSYIEKGKDGYAYFTKNDGLYKFNRNSNSISKVLNLSLVPTLPFLRLVTGEILKPEVRVYSLPGIIDYYQNETLNDFGIVVNSISIKSPKFSNKQTFGNSYHKLTPRGYGEIVVLDSLIITNIAKWVTFDSMTIQFAEGSFLRIMGGADLELKGTKLMGACGEMWNGIEIVQNGLNNSSLTCKKNAVGRKTMIRDALIGVETKSVNHFVQIYDSTIFTANKIGIRLNNANQNSNKITNTFFIDSVKLYNGGKTEIAIEIVKSDIQLGHVDSLPIVVIGGSYGISAKVSKRVGIQNVQFKKTENQAINFLNVDDVRIHRSKISNCNLLNTSSAIVIDGYKNFKFTGNIVKQNFSSGALAVLPKLGGRAVIGGTLSDSNRIVVNNGIGINYSGWASTFYNNPMTRNFEIAGRPLSSFFNPIFSLFIEHNNIVCTGSGYGISVERNGLSGKLYFDTLSICNNRLVAENGIALNNINTKEINQILPMQSDWLNGYTKRHIANNLINLKNGEPYMEGIGLNISNSDHIYCVGNKFVHKGVYSHPFFNSNTGVRIFGSQNILIYNDSFLSLNRGVVIDGANYYSNIYCNFFSTNMTSVKLDVAKLRLKYNPSPIFPFNTRAHGTKVLSALTARSNQFVEQVYNSSIFNNDKLGLADYCKWVLESNTLVNPFLLSAPKNRGFVFSNPGNNPCGNFMSNPNTASNIEKLEDIDVVPNVVEDFWDIYANSKYNMVYAKSSVTPSFQKDLIDLELAIDTGSLLGVQSALNKLTPVYQMQQEIKYVFSNWYEYISNYDTIYTGNGKMRSFQIWDSDTTWHINNLISDTAVFFVNYKGLHDTILSKLDTMSNYNPFHTKPASYFARNLLCFMGKKCNFIDSFYNDLVPITGRVTSNCFGGGVQGINVKLFDEYNVYTGVSTVTEAAGYFRFSGTELMSLDSTNRYYVRVYLPSDSNHISMTARIRNLQFDSLLNIDCIFPGPAPLGNEMSQFVKINIHPNPVSEDLVISGLKFDRPVQISIVDATGSTKKKFNFESNDGKDIYLDIFSLCSGFYFVIVESDSLNYIEKIIINRN